MAKPFKNYRFEFDKNEKKILTTFLNQMLKQYGGNAQAALDEKLVRSSVDKINSDEPSVTFTKNEFTVLQKNLEYNVKFMEERAAKANFFIRWFYNIMAKQYRVLFNTHFKD